MARLRRWSARRSSIRACLRGAVELLSGDREELAALATADGLVDLVIPRGGGGLKAALKEVATVPVMYAAAGVCHVYVHADADLEMAARIAVNAKVQRPGVCNAAETLLVDGAVAEAFLPAVARELADAGVELVGDERARGAAGGVEMDEATDEDWETEYHDLKLSIGVVDGVDEAIEHINAHGTGHSDAIVTASEEAADAFTSGRRLGLRLRECFDALHRRLRVRDGRGDRQLDAEAACARPDRDEGADDVQVRDARQRPDPRVGRFASRIGVLGGAFNPPHIGHLVLAHEAAHQLGLERVLLIPAGVAPHREIDPEPGADVRLEMVRAGGGGG